MGKIPVDILICVHRGPSHGCGSLCVCLWAVQKRWQQIADFINQQLRLTNLRSKEECIKQYQSVRRPRPGPTPHLDTQWRLAMGIQLRLQGVGVLEASTWLFPPQEPLVCGPDPCTSVCVRCGRSNQRPRSPRWTARRRHRPGPRGQARQPRARGARAVCACVC
jgi:hypothetical protein